MGGGIEMDGIHDVLETSQRALCHQMDVLIPVRTANQYDIIGVVLANLANHLCGIFLQVCPCVLHGLVVYLVDDMRVFAVFLCHHTEEPLCLGSLHLVGVPVDDDIDIILNGCFDDIGHALHGKLWVLQVVVLNHDTHGSTYHTGIPVLLQCLHRFLVIEAGPDVMPSEADTTQDDGSAVLVTQLCALHL